MILPPTFNLKGNKVRATSIMAQATQLYNFTTNQAEIGGANYFSRSFRLSDGSIISISTSKTSIYEHRIGKVTIIGAGNIQIVSNPQFLLYPNSSRPFWNKGMRVERWYQNSNPSNKFIRLIRKDSSWLAIPNYTLEQISPRDTLNFLHVIPETSNFYNSPSKYIFKVNGVILDRYVETPSQMQWLPNTSYTNPFEVYNISITVNKPSIGYAEEGGNEITGYYFATINGGVGRIVDLLSERILLDPAYPPSNNGLFTVVEAYSNSTGMVSGIGDNLGGLLGKITYETISADSTFLYRSEVNTSKDPFNFFDIYQDAPGVDRINNIKNKDVHYILT